MATPRQSEHTFPDTPGSWTLRSAGGPRPALVVWGTATPAADILDRFARAGFAVLSPSPDVAAAGLVGILDGLPRGVLGGATLQPVGLLSVGPSAGEAGLAKELDERGIPWLHAADDWDAALRWFAERLT